MKRQYGTPKVIFEDFALTANIATSCGDSLKFQGDADVCMHYANHSDSSNCVFFENGYSTFYDVAICDLQPDEDGGWSHVCYHVIVDEWKAFSS